MRPINESKVSPIMQTIPVMQNPQLAGDSFFWPAGSVGVLLSHGFTATTAEVRPLARILHQAGYTVSGPLLPGHGSIPQDANRYTWQDWTAAIAMATRELQEGCTQIFLGGESMGGLLALFQAAQMPQAVGVLLYAPAIRFRPRLVGPLTRVMAPFLSSKNKPHATPTVADTRWQGYTVYPLKAMRQLLELQKQVCKRLPKVSQPLLLIQGRNDRSVHPTGPEIINQNVASTIKEIHWLDNSGHCVMLEEQCQQVEDFTLEFIQRILNKRTPD